jgi:hypothetical protein
MPSGSPPFSSNQKQQIFQFSARLVDEIFKFSHARISRLLPEIYNFLWSGFSYLFFHLISSSSSPF